MVSSPNNVNLLIHYNNQLTVVEQYFGEQYCRAIFHNYCCYTEHGGIHNKFHSTKSGGILLICQNTTMCVAIWSMEYKIYVQKNIAHWAVRYSFPLVLDKLIGAHTFVRLICSLIKIRWSPNPLAFITWKTVFMVKHNLKVVVSPYWDSPYTENQEWSWCQLCHHWWHCRLT